jgi:hypothetical protein
LAKLVSFIPFAEQEQCAREESSFKETAKESGEQCPNEAGKIIVYLAASLACKYVTYFFDTPVKTDKAPHNNIHKGSCNEGFPHLLSSMLL